MYRLTAIAAAAVLLALSLSAFSYAADAAPGAAERFAQAVSDFGRGDYVLASAGAREVARLFPGSEWEGRALFLAGRSDAAKGELDAAMEAFGLSKKMSPLLSDYADYLMAGACMEAGRYDDAAALYIATADARPSGPLASDSLLRAARALSKSGRADDEVKTLIRLVDRNPGRSLTAEALYMLTQAGAVAGDTRAVYGYYSRLLLEHPDSRFERMAADIARGLATPENPVPEPDPAGRLKRADKLSSLGMFSRAVAEYDKALAGMPEDGPVRGDALIGLGYALYKARENDRAEKVLSGIAGSEHYADKSPEALYWLCRTYLRVGKDDKFRAAARRCADLHPGSARAVDCLYLLGVELTYDKLYDEAHAALDSIISGYPASDDYPDALWRLGWLEFLRGEYEEAERTLGELLDRYPDSEHTARAMYWRARALGASGGNEAASALYDVLTRDYGVSYYGVIAEKPAGLMTAGGWPGIDKAGVEQAAPATPSTDDTFRRAMELKAVGMPEYGVRELKAAEAGYSSSPERLEDIAGVYGELGEYKRPLEAAERLYRTRMRTGRTPIPDKMMRIIFPAGFWDFITREAEAFDVDPFLVAALVREESHFDPEAVSSAGAIGLMQLMPKTAAAVCRSLGRPEPTDAGLKQGDMNLPLGTCHLGYLLERHGGRLVYALAEYNAGPAALARWQARMPDAPDDVFVENIGYLETRNYVRRVIRNYGIYRELYGRKR